MILFNLLSTSEVLEETVDAVSSAASTETTSILWDKFMDFLIRGGEKILIAILVLVVGKFLISLIKRLVRGFLNKRKVEPGVKSFLMSLVNILLLTLLIVSVVSALGINTTSFAALIASAGVAIGMALSGNLQNFAGGVIVLLFKPFRVGDFIDCQGVSGTVREIQIFHTVITTPDNKEIFIPNGSLSSGVITNVNSQSTRRVQWVIGVEYGENYLEVEAAIRDILASDERILKSPEPFVALNELADSSVNFVVRGWVVTSDYWGVYFETNRKIYEEFNKRGIGFPFPQLTIHKAEA
ncbi:MscS Mechanosensitive ion channel [Bacteroides coprosuis DSM 18011]|uniref:MscS Mechanosensitive ion channel n=1 Tax=Bacteroides coprosuis DSM 18011 TaxID=679937 RepID=F3ZSC5_9BACE|nr:mechanosensitive ion channel domain-containing protein [Bacteroides coprosuis]EGJ70862.1 MscS Mechanosensitive ion channel [Bacteroides coprosuis DSM 18011]HJD91474.1 mechanosensitive ion channel [Bacteroides coprosuis]